MRIDPWMKSIFTFLNYWNFFLNFKNFQRCNRVKSDVKEKNEWDWDEKVDDKSDFVVVDEAVSIYDSDFEVLS